MSKAHQDSDQGTPAAKAERSSGEPERRAPRPNAHEASESEQPGTLAPQTHTGAILAILLLILFGSGSAIILLSSSSHNSQARLAWAS